MISIVLLILQQQFNTTLQADLDNKQLLDEAEHDIKNYSDRGQKTIIGR